LSSAPGNGSIARQINRWLGFAIGALLIVMGVAIEGLLRVHLRAEFDQVLLAKAHNLAARVEQDEDGTEFDYSPDAPPVLERPRDADYFELWLSGWPASRRSSTLAAAHLPRLADREAQPRFLDLTLPGGAPGRAVQLDFLPVLDPKENLDPTRTLRPLATLVVARSRARFDHLITRLRLALVLVVSVALGVSYRLVRTAVARGLTPLAEVSAELAVLNAQNLHARLSPAAAASELNPLIVQFNTLIADLEAAFTREQAFAAAAAHELRTPLAEIRNLAEVGSRFATERAVARDYFDEIVAAATQMEALTRNLLALVRPAEFDVAHDMSSIDVVAAAAQAWRREAALATARNLSYHYLGPAVVGVRLSPSAADLLLGNLLGNAIVHSPDGAEIRLSCTQHEASLSLEVANPCDALVSADLARMFEPFWRKDPARSANGHLGLGLALVRSCATHLGIRCVAELRDGTIVIGLHEIPLA